jgi:hypothetical protein
MRAIEVTKLVAIRGNARPRPRWRSGSGIASIRDDVFASAKAAARMEEMPDPSGGSSSDTYPPI